jgi:hypothetical protein
MKRVMMAVWVALALAGCSAAEQPNVTVLTVTNGSVSSQYSVDDLRAFPAVESAYGEITYRGVVLSALLEDAGFNPQNIRIVSAQASDGFSASYDPPLFLRDDVLVAYETADGPLSAEDGLFRMVLPGEEGRLNVRLLVELRVHQ